MAETRRTRGPVPVRAGAILAPGILLLATAAPADAQWGGFGFGWGYNQNAYSDVNYLNSRANINASAAAADRPQALTAPRFESRDDGFYDKYDLATRESMIDRVARDPGREMGTADPSGVVAGPGPRTPQPASPPAPRPVVHLADFFDRSRQLVWPGAGPITGDLGKKQEVADQAVLAVLNEYELKGLAALSSVTEARRKLIDYGQPALEYVREKTTPAIADSFHVFLLSLYANVGLAATVPKAP